MRFTVPASPIFFTLLFRALCYAKNSLEPMDLTCFNDYESEMKCNISSKNCSEYKLNVTHYPAGEQTEYACVFKAYGSANDCECKVEVQDFVMGENFSTALLKGGNVLFTKVLETGEFLKPKTPVLEIEKTEKGNFKVTWDANYKNKDGSFVNGLKIKLYGIAGKGQKGPLEGPNTVGFIEIISSNLDPKTKYSLSATMSTHYNRYTIESDQSKSIAFTTPSSPDEILKLIPVVCVALITLIFIIFIMTFGIKRVWWDKISKPKINSDFDPERNINTLSPSIVPISSIRTDILKSDYPKSPRFDLNKSISSSVNTNEEQSSASVDSAVMDYGHTGIEVWEDENIHIVAMRELEKALGLKSSIYSKVPVVTEYHLGYQRKPICFSKDSGNCSGSSCFSNLAYIKSPADSSEFLKLTCNILNTNEPSINSGYHPVDSDTGKTQSGDNPNERLTTDVRLSDCGALKVCQTGGHATFQQSSFILPLHGNIKVIYPYHPV